MFKFYLLKKNTTIIAFFIYKSQNEVLHLDT